MKKLSVIIPAYNEGRRIPNTLRDIEKTLSNKQFDYEILVISDGSKDDTAEVVENLIKQMPKLFLIKNQENHGKGWVTKQGMLKASGDICLFMDADNSTRVEEVFKMLPFFDEGFDIVIGSRRIQGSNIAAKQPMLRDFLGWVFRTIVHILVPVSVTDSQCGFKVFTNKAVRIIFPKQTIFRWAFDVEILALARKNKLKIKEAPVTWVNDAESHVKFSGMVKMLLEIMQIRLNLWFGKYK